MNDSREGEGEGPDASSEYEEVGCHLLGGVSLFVHAVGSELQPAAAAVGAGRVCGRRLDALLLDLSAWRRDLPSRRVFQWIGCACLRCCRLGLCLYVIVQTEPLFSSFWSDGFSLGNRAGSETTADYIVGVIGVLLVLEATRRSIGWIVPLLAIAFMAHSYYCYGSFRYDWPVLPDWMLPHAGQNVKDIVSTTFLQSLGVFGPAASVMFKYVFLFVVFGSFLEMSGATQFIIDFATKAFGRVRGGPAMVVGDGQRLDGFAFGQCGGQRGDDRNLHDSDDAWGSVSQSHRRWNHGGGGLRWRIGSAGDGCGCLHDAGIGSAAGDVPDDHEGGDDSRDSLLLFDSRGGVSLLASLGCGGSERGGDRQEEAFRIRGERFHLCIGHADRFAEFSASRRFAASRDRSPSFWCLRRAREAEHLTAPRERWPSPVSSSSWFCTN